MSDPALTTATVVAIKKAVLASSAGGVTLASVIWWEKLLAYWPIFVALIGVLIFIGKFIRRVDDMDKSNGQQHEQIEKNVIHGIDRIEQKFETFTEMFKHRDTRIKHVERRINELESRTFRED